MRNLLFTLLLAIAVVLPYESSAQIDLGKALGILLGEGTTVQQQPRSPLEEIAENIRSYLLETAGACFISSPCHMRR